MKKFQKILTVIAMTTFLASATAVPSFADDEQTPAERGYGILAVAKNKYKNRPTPASNPLLNQIAQSRADSLAREDKLVYAIVDKGVALELSGKGYGSTHKLLARSKNSSDSAFETLVKSKHEFVVSTAYNNVGVGVSKVSKTNFTYVVAIYADYKKPAPKPKPKPVVAPKPAPKPKPVAKPKPAAPKPTTKPVAPTPKPSTPTTKPSMPKPAAKPKPAAPNPAEAAKLKAAEEKAAKAEAAVKEQEKKAEADAEQRRTEAAKGKLESDQAIADAAELARVADTARMEKEQETAHVKSVIRDIVGYTGNGSIGLGLLLLAASAIIRKKPLLELPRWTKADLDFDFDD